MKILVEETKISGEDIKINNSMKKNLWRLLKKTILICLLKSLKYFLI
jgi:hypothetical protein